MSDFAEFKVDLQVRLPPELPLVILHHLRFDRNALRQFCLVSRQLRSLSQPFIFEHISVGTQATRQIKSRSPCSSLYETRCESPHIVTHIRHVDIVSPRLGPTWIARESTLPLLLTLLADAEIVRTFRLRCSSESWGDLPLELQHSIQLLLKSPSLRNLDFSGVVRLTTDIFKYCRSGECFGTIESFTSLDMHVVDVVAWMIATPSFRTLRDLRIAVTHDEVNALQNLLRHVSGTLESLSLQLIIWYWPKGAPTCSISLPSLRSLRLSVGITKPCCDDDDIFHWAICFLLEQHRYKALQHLTLDLRFDDASDPHAHKWSELDSALSDFMFSALKTLVVTLFPMYPEAEPVARLVGDELPRLLPWTRLVRRPTSQRHLVDNSNPPKQVTNKIGRIMLHKGDLTTPVILADNFSILLGHIEVTVPWVEDGSDYQIVLFGDSGNFSPLFTISGP
ncbi:hypothetical protein R3P38DRAFT_3276413 [Favolaschia claudopus]|uniref:F-box domain-containing protein n=1 Tax=Favolaschia claudopus TaxID=2862362 RepID=A0AAW0ARY3_9AGAR